jgi:signal transduction histidine kinase
VADAVATAREPLGPTGGGLVAEVRLRPAAYAALVPSHGRGGAVVLLSALLAAGVCATVLAAVGVRRVERLAELRADFVANVSHELRTPLGQIALSAETLRLGRERSADERARFLGVIAREAERLRALVERVLAFSALERGAPRLAPEPTELGALAREVAGAFALHAPAGVAIVVVADDAVWAEVDRDALRQVLGNLLDNALKHGPERQTVTVAVRGAAAERGAPHALVTVDDEGHGVAARDRRRIFEPYARLDRARREAVAGSGLGRAVVDRLGRAHGGRVRVEDAPPPAGGARFVVELPGLAIDREPAPAHAGAGGR